MNLNDAFEVVKCYHNGTNYVYLYKFAPKSNTYHAVVVYDNTEENILESQIFPNLKLALTEYNKKKNLKDNNIDL